MITNFEEARQNLVEPGGPKLFSDAARVTGLDDFLVFFELFVN